MSEVFSALADPTRRSVLECLVGEGPSTATGLADRFGITRQGVAKHLATLADAGLAHPERVGRETRYRADLDALDGVTAWVDRVRGEWKQRLELLASSLESPPS